MKIEISDAVIKKFNQEAMSENGEGEEECIKSPKKLKEMVENYLEDYFS